MYKNDLGLTLLLIKTRTMRQSILVFSLLTLLNSCYKGKSVDLIIHNAIIHSMDESNSKYEAVAIKNGKIIEVGPERQILNKYSADGTIDAQQKDVYPGFTDAHCHIMSYARQKLSADLTGSRSYEEMLVRLEKYQGKHNRKVIQGRGWDQSLWKSKEMPDNKRLNELFPNTPVCLIRIDGHALLANDAMLRLTKINALDKENIASGKGYSEGVYYEESGKPTGLLVDQAMDPVLNLLPEYPEKEIQDAILEIQQELYGLGITGVHEAGVTNKDFKLLDKMVSSNKLDVNIYCMLLTEKANIDFARKQGIYKNRNLDIRSFKVFGDGALGSRGACLKEPYSDMPGHFGHMTVSFEHLDSIANLCIETGYQMNTHAIGDSTNKVLLEVYKKHTIGNPDHRWRIEHAQVLDPSDFKLFAESGAFPSIQPTHAISDQRWAEDRLGKGRMAGAYAYKSLLEQFGMLAIGTDFPVEITDPFRTIHAAVQRKDTDDFPSGGFLPSEALTLDQCIRGMTIWAALAAFQEEDLGTIEKGKDATFVIFDSPVLSKANYEPNFAYMTFINGKKVYSVE